MLLNMYSIYDSKSKVYSKPFYCLNQDIALRSIVDLLTNGDSDPRRHPEDFHLYYIGEFDDSTGVIISCDGAQHLFKFIDIPLPNPVPDNQLSLSV